jgi:hypothetical protein
MEYLGYDFRRFWNFWIRVKEKFGTLSRQRWNMMELRPCHEVRLLAGEDIYLSDTGMQTGSLRAWTRCEFQCESMKIY